MVRLRDATALVVDDGEQDVCVPQLVHVLHQLLMRTVFGAEFVDGRVVGCQRHKLHAMFGQLDLKLGEHDELGCGYGCKVW